VAETVIEREFLRHQLLSAGWKVPPAQGNFVWLPAGADSVRLSRAYSEAGILTRCFEGEGLRITVGTRAQNERVAALAADWHDR
jgi:histidinol-phosphate aminotransferase